jgi:peptide/nickel transport system substrate-binding protein
MTIPSIAPMPMNGHLFSLPGFLNNHLLRVSKPVFDRLNLNNLLVVILMVGLVACSQKPAPSTVSLPTPPVSSSQQPTISVSEPAPTVTLLPTPRRLLTICLGREPSSLFYYDATSTAARDILAAVYDGPVDIQNYIAHPVILEKVPSLMDGDAVLQPVQVNPGDLMVDYSGNPVNLEAGVEYRPSGCSENACAQIYEGDQPIQMDQLVLDFKLLPGIQWSDGTLLTSSDSVYSYEIARALFPAAQSELILRTQSYQSTDDRSIKWIGIPGYQDGTYHTKFFTPLPQHIWHTYTVEELRTIEISTRKPLGWGAYIIDEWISGDHISLHKNPLYFRAGENLPKFDNLVFRFVNNPDEALDALLAGECDLLDQTAMLETQTSRLSELQKTGQVLPFYQNDAGWEQISFGIIPSDTQRVELFASKEVRQAVAMCIDREALVADQTLNAQLLMDSFVPSSHPLYNPGVQHYTLDLQKAIALLESVGWQDPDNDPTTPRIAQGVAGIPDDTPFEVEYLVSSESKPQSDAQAIQEMLGQCGIRTKILAQQPGQYLAPGPDGPVFGRSFDLAQFAWTASLEPPCYLYITSEIPGPYPDFPKGWGGVNASGYTNPQYDQACEDALFSLSDSPQHLAEHFRAQEIFSEELPGLPLYVHFTVSVARPDMCNYTSTSAMDSPLWSLETLDYGCSQ